MIKIENSPFKGKNAVEQCDNGCVGVYLTHPFLSSIFILSLSNPGGMPGVCRRSSVGKSVSPIMKMSLVQVQPSAPCVPCLDRGDSGAKVVYALWGG